MSVEPRLQAAVIVVHERAHAEAALAAAEELARPVVLLSPPGAAAFMGAAYFQAMIARAMSDHPGARVLAVLDCGERAGEAMGALRQGIEAVCFRGPAAVAGKLRDIARQQGAAVIETRPDALDLAGVDDARGACRNWLRKSAEAGEARSSLQ